MGTALTNQPTQSSPRIAPFPTRQCTVAEYHHLIDTNFFTENDDVELLEGWIAPKMPRNPRHDGTIDLVESQMRPLLPNGWRLRIQQAITTADSEPEPDLTVVQGDERSFLARHPEPQDVGLLVEVSGSTLQFDRVDKGRVYARARIGCYWIVNLVDRQIEVYTNPTGPIADPHYHQRRDIRPGDTVPLELQGQVLGAIAVAALLP